MRLRQGVLHGAEQQSCKTEPNGIKASGEISIEMSKSSMKSHPFNMTKGGGGIGLYL